MRPENIQGLIALGLLILTVALSKMVIRISEIEDAPYKQVVLFYLRILVGFTLMGAIYFAFYAFAGVDVLNR